MRAHLWTLNGRVPEACGDILRWAQWFETAERQVALRTFADGAVVVSTVFLGFDHGWLDGPPVVFETMIFGGVHAESMRRYCTWDEAEQGHREMVTLASAAVEQSNVVAELLAGVVINAIRQAENT